jgi:hypothetical protein
MLKPLSEIPSLKYFNEIGGKNEHFNFVTKSDKWSPRNYEISNW